MTITNRGHGIMDKIDKQLWHTCRFCNKNIKELAKLYGGGGIYYTEVFIKHLKMDHSDFDINMYFDTIPLCPCGCFELCKITGTKSSNFKWSQPCGRYEGTLKWSNEAKFSRLGKNNPMYGKSPWNLGLTKNTSDSVKEISNKAVGRQISEETKHKQSESAKRRTIHGHTGFLHSEDSKELMRQSTLSRIRNGEIKHTRTKPHIEMCNILDELNINYDEEVVLHYWSFDLYVKEYDLYVEVDGDYFHSNPLKYPNGPETKTQKINKYRDIKKNEYCQNNNIKLLRFWESDILNNREKIICTLKKLLDLR